MIEIIKNSILTLLLMLTVSCASVESYWASVPEPRFEDRARSFDGALVEVETIRHRISGLSAFYTTASGLIYPFVDEPAPQLDEAILILEWIIIPDYSIAHNQRRGMIPRSSLLLTTASGPVQPSHVEITTDGSMRRYQDYWYPFPEWIEFTGDTTVRMVYPNVKFVENATYSVQPTVSFRGMDFTGPQVRFEARKKHRYHFFQFPSPFFIPSPR